jgi:hypothetical protein
LIRRRSEKSVVSLYLAEGKIEPEVIGNMRSWQHGGFSVDQTRELPCVDMDTFLATF